MHLMGTIFSSRLIHIWCCSEYLGQRGGVCGRESEETSVCIHGH